MSMNSQKRLLVSLGLLTAGAVGAGALAYFGVYKADKAETARKEAESKAFAFEKADLRKMEVKVKDQTFVIERDGEGWKLTAPLATAADKFPVEALVDRLVSLKSKLVVADDLSKAADFGLSSPEVGVTVNYAKGDGPVQTAGVRVGDTSTFDSSTYYLRDGDTHIYLGDSGLRGALEKNLFELREKRLLPWEPDAVQSLTVEVSGGGFAVQRDGAAWKLTAPQADAADLSAVNGLVANLVAARGTSVALEADAAAQPGALAAFGLEQPAAVTTLLVGGEKKTVVAHWGQVKGTGDAQDKLYGRLAAGGPVWVLDNSLLVQMQRPWDEMRDKMLVHMNRSAVRTVEITGAARETVTLARLDEAKDDDAGKPEKWSVNGSTERVRVADISRLLGDLESARATRVVGDDGRSLATLGLEPPAHRVVLKDGKGTVLADLSLSAAVDGKAYAVPAGSRRVVEISSSVVDTLPSSAQSLIEQPAATGTAPSAQGG